VKIDLLKVIDAIMVTTITDWDVASYFIIIFYFVNEVIRATSLSKDIIFKQAIDIAYHDVSLEPLSKMFFDDLLNLAR
jgi:hypothetical protein